MDAPGLDALVARLRRVEDELALLRMLNDYAAFLDGRDWDRYVALFTAEGEWTNPGGSYRGRAAIRAMLESNIGPAGTPNPSTYHIISNPQVDLDGDNATATSRFLFVMRGPDNRPTPALAGLYRDNFVREDGQWKIRQRVAEDIIPTPEQWQAMLAARQAAP